MTKEEQESISRKIQQANDILKKKTLTEPRKTTCLNILNKLEKAAVRFDDKNLEQTVSKLRSKLTSSLVSKSDNLKTKAIIIQNRKYTDLRTQVIFFDLEFYVPKIDQQSDTLAANPCKEGHLLLGGTFLNYKPLKSKKKEQLAEFWLWNFKSEKELVGRIVKYFEEAWELALGEKGQAELTLCGIGISRVDIGYLYSKAMQYKIRPNEVLFKLFYNVRMIELECVAIPFFRAEHNMLIGKSTKDLLKLFNISRNRKHGSSVWQNYEYKKFNKIEERNKNEVNDMLAMYKAIYTKLGKKHL